MVLSNIKKHDVENSVRAPDPNVLQYRAANPQDSVWVSASAGSGKTKVLTDRILRLLLPSADGQSGTLPYKILALTFTKAAASEMVLRINKELSAWATLPLEGKKDKNLSDALEKLLKATPTSKQIESARRLFAQVIDVPGGLKIMTIHSFCQSLLGRFPIEAGLSPNFKILEENHAQGLLIKARDSVLTRAVSENGSPLSQAIHQIAIQKNEEQFLGLLNNIISERRQFKQILEKTFGVDGLYTNLCASLSIEPNKTSKDIIYDGCNDGAFDETNLRQACQALSQAKSKGDLENSIILQSWLDAGVENRVEQYDNYKNMFLKKDGDIRTKLATVPVVKIMPDILEVMFAEAERVYALEQAVNAGLVASLTRDLFYLGQDILDKFQALKEQKSALDFEDLILQTLNLLDGKSMNMSAADTTPWVRFKLDQGIDHILVDEAQDTNPEQWEIIKLLCDDFYAGNASKEYERTVFIVGDEKQSIFSFQRASPDKFNDMKSWFQARIDQAQKEFSVIDFQTSFRSVPSVLSLVDNVFSTPEMVHGLGGVALEHHAFKSKQAGLVELWPIMTSPEKEQLDPWTPPVNIIESQSGAAKMADYIGEQIKGWIDNKVMLEGKGRPIQAGDIMILLRSRTAFVDQLVRSLKTKDIPVSGVDRMVLNDQLVVQDLCACASFALLPDDDLTLASLLKSPFIGLDEEQLFELSYKRDSTLWQSLKKSEHLDIITWLEKIIRQAGRQKPYEFFSCVLQEKCPAHDRGGLLAIKERLGQEVLDPLDEFLNIALGFEKENIPNLQLFLQDQLANNTQVKRQMEEAGQAVRIMTVHGSKGLQAPIVILPDTIRGTSPKADQILWPDRSGLDLPYFCPQAKSAPDLCQGGIDTLKARDNDEYRRLLYVALTRAENRLYIGGYTNAKKPAEESWYRYIEQGFKKLPDIEEILFSDAEDNDAIILRYTNPDLENADQETHKNILEKVSVDIPDWLFKPMPAEPTPPRPLVPSRPSENLDVALSPLHSNKNDRFKRGNITHKLLQILPDIPSDAWESTAQKFLNQSAHELSVSVQKSILDETLAILNHPEFAPIFGENSMAEVPITGLVRGNVMVSGQIDRLLITQDEVFIIDYKTNRPAPIDEKDVPLIYRNQLQSYADVLCEIYPAHKIRTALLWTDTARLMEIEL